MSMFVKAFATHRSPEASVFIPCLVEHEGDDFKAAYFGELEFVRDLGLTSKPDSGEMFGQMEQLAEHDLAEMLQQADAGSTVIGLADIVIKHAKTANTLKEAIVTECVREGLAKTLGADVGPRIPRVIGGTCTRSSGILITERVMDYEPVINFSPGAQGLFVQGKEDRVDMYREALRAVGFTNFSSVRDSFIDDNFRNTLWPASFHELDDGEMQPADYVRIDFGNIPMRTEDIVFVPRC